MIRVEAGRMLIGLAQTIFTDPTHEGIAVGSFVIGILSSAVILLLVLMPLLLLAWKKFGPYIREFGRSVTTIAAAPSAPDAKSLIAATHDGVRDAFLPLADSVNKLITENKELREEATDRASMNAGLVDRLNRLEQKGLRDQTQLDEQQAQIGTLEAKVATLETGSAAKDNDLAILKSQVSARDASLREKEAALASALNTVADLQKLVADQAEKLQALLPLEGQYQQLIAEVAALKAQLKMIDKLEGELQNAKAELKVVQDALAAMTVERDTLRHENETLHGEVTVLHTQVANQQDKIAFLQRPILDADKPESTP